MVIRVYISGNSGNKEIVTHQQRIFMILNSLGIDNTPVDIAGPGMDEVKDFMRANGKKKDGQRNVLPPQIFNEEKYCGDYNDFDVANEDDLLEEFLGIPRKAPLEPPKSTGTTDDDSSKLPREDESPTPMEEDEPINEKMEEVPAEPEESKPQEPEPIIEGPEPEPEPQEPEEEVIPEPKESVKEEAVPEPEEEAPKVEEETAKPPSTLGEELCIDNELMIPN